MKQLLSSKQLLILLLAVATPTSLMAESIHEQNDGARCMEQRADHQWKPEHADIPPAAMGIPPSLRSLDLTDAQQDNIFKLMYVQIPGLRDQAKQKHVTMDELRKLSNSDGFDDVKAQKLAEKLAAIEKELILSRARNEAKIYSILTPEQRQKLEEKRVDKESSGHDEFVKYRLENKVSPTTVRF